MKKTNKMKAIYGDYARKYYYKVICSRLIEVYDENKKYLYDVESISELMQIIGGRGSI